MCARLLDAQRLHKTHCPPWAGITQLSRIRLFPFCFQNLNKVLLKFLLCIWGWTGKAEQEEGGHKKEKDFFFELVKIRTGFNERNEMHTSERNRSPVIGIEKYTVIPASVIGAGTSEKDLRNDQGRVFCKQIFASRCTAICHMFPNTDSSFMVCTCGCFGAHVYTKRSLNWISDWNIKQVGNGLFL